MKATELMIGNYVKDPYDKTIKLVSVEKYASFLTPIPLTEEWLLRFGFKNLSLFIGKCDLFYELAYYPNHKELWIRDFENDEIVCLTEKLLYVHQLQNLYFALTGNELTIKRHENN